MLGEKDPEHILFSATHSVPRALAGTHNKRRGEAEKKNKSEEETKGRCLGLRDALEYPQERCGHLCRVVLLTV